MFTCDNMLDSLSFLIAALFLIYNLEYNKNRNVRYLCFFSMTILMSYLIAVQYNTDAIENEKKATDNFGLALFIVICVFILDLLLLPLFMRYMGMVGVLSTTFLLGLIALIIGLIFIGDDYKSWVIAALIIFYGLLTTDLVRLTTGCKKHKRCDPLEGASILYIDILNLFKQFFILLNKY